MWGVHSQHTLCSRANVAVVYVCAAVYVLSIWRGVIGTVVRSGGEMCMCRVCRLSVELRAVDVKGCCCVPLLSAVTFHNSPLS